MSFIEAVKTCFSKYVDFNGRARRSEYWFWYLFNFLVTAVAGIIQGQNSSVLTYIVSLALLLPGISVAVRRMHDVGKSGWYLLLVFIPVVGLILVLIQMCSEGTAGANEYGPDPKNIAVGAVPETFVKPAGDPVPAEPVIVPTVPEEPEPQQEEYTDVIMETVEKERRESRKFCSSCGCIIREGQKFCTNCGAPVQQ